ncbi:MAG: FeoC-like transcriptional regulator [Gammaproteobacteria bacterium]|nr:FeoC-like transcriptional regulator [Gammaproteobacteria bacterium]
MSLLEIRDHLMQVKMASLSSLAVYFNRDADVLRGMLSHWVRCGRVRCFMKTAACGGACHKCPSATTEIYEWLEVV